MKNEVLAIITDAHNCHAMTEELIDVWWGSLTPAEKAEIYTASLEDREQLAMTVCGGVRKADTLGALLQLGNAAMKQMREIQEADRA